MVYICGDIFDEKDSCKCKSEKQRYNQCCQDCNEVRTCKNHCDYTHDYDCIIKEEFNED